MESRIAELNGLQANTSNKPADLGHVNFDHLSLADLNEITLSVSDSDDEYEIQNEQRDSRSGRPPMQSSLNRLEMLDRSLEADINRISFIESDKVDVRNSHSKSVDGM